MKGDVTHEQFGGMDISGQIWEREHGQEKAKRSVRLINNVYFERFKSYGWNQSKLGGGGIK